MAIILEWESQAMLRPRVVAAIVITSIATSYESMYSDTEIQRCRSGTKIVTKAAPTSRRDVEL